jgi:predicted ABC-type ATPase
MVGKKGAGPVLYVLAGPNGAGTSTFYLKYVAPLKLPFVNADMMKKELADKGEEVSALEAARRADKKRREYFGKKKSYCMETVFSDSKGEKRKFFQEAREAGYAVILVFIGLDQTETSKARVLSRVMAGGHNVPSDKLVERYPRTLENLRLAIPHLDHVFIFDNSSFDEPYRLVATFVLGELRQLFMSPIPPWAQGVLHKLRVGKKR